MQTAIMTTNELMRANTRNGHALDAAGKIDPMGVESRRLLRERREIRNELERRQAAETN